MKDILFRFWLFLDKHMFYMSKRRPRAAKGTGFLVQADPDTRQGDPNRGESNKYAHPEARQDGKGTLMASTLRKPEIISIARREGAVSVDHLVAHFGVTPQTIRRDLTELAEAGQLERVHGGAILPSKTTNIGYSERRQLNQGAKVDIARACAAQIPNHCTLFLNIGTTTEAVAAELMRHEGLIVVTNNINIAVILSANEAIDLVMTGGNLRRSDGGLIGDLAKQTIGQFRFDYAVIGCSALREDGDILDYDLLEVGVSKEIIARSDHVFLVADASKFERKAPARIASLSSVGTFFTDRDPPERTRALCRAAGTRIIVAGEDRPVTGAMARKQASPRHEGSKGGSARRS
jgi:DeoR family glycerol-3-phosphate regulon repressor